MICNMNHAISHLGHWLLHDSLRVIKLQPRFKVCNISYLCVLFQSSYLLFTFWYIKYKKIKGKECIYVTMYDSARQQNDSHLFNIKNYTNCFKDWIICSFISLYSAFVVSKLSTRHRNALYLAAVLLIVDQFVDSLTATMSFIIWNYYLFIIFIKFYKWPQIWSICCNHYHNLVLIHDLSPGL